MASVYIKTYGCQMNERDSEAVVAQLLAKGYSLAPSEATADVILLNTCSVRDAAEQKALNKMENLVAETRRHRPNVVLGFLGCMAQSRGQELIDRLPDVDLVVGTQKFHRAADYLDDILQGRRDKVVDIAQEGGSEATIREHLLNGNAKKSVTAYVSIMQGCNQYCTFCIVPHTRGQERSRTIADIVAECRELVSNGVKEITLLGQIVTSFGRSPAHGQTEPNSGGAGNFQYKTATNNPLPLTPTLSLGERENRRQSAGESETVGTFDGCALQLPLPKGEGRGEGEQALRKAGGTKIASRDLSSSSPFVRLLEAVHEIEGLERIRFTSPHPKGYGDDLVEAYGRMPKLVESAHIPVQSGSDRVLKLMHRVYTRARFLDIIGKLRRVQPHMGISTDFIVGFPGETENDFEETLSLAREVEFDQAFIFKYSPRRDTPAATMPEQVPHMVKEERHQRLLTLINEIGARRYQNLVGQQVEILVEGPSKRPERWMGRTRCNKIVVFDGSERHRAALLRVKITRAGSFTLYGNADILNDE